MSRLRAFQFRRTVLFVRRHPEYIGCAIVAGLISLALLQTDWTPYSRQPRDITDRVSETRTSLEHSGWPDSERARFLTLEPSAVASFVTARLHDPITLDRASQPPIKTLGQYFWIREPDLIPVRHVLASQGRVLIDLAPALAVADDLEEHPADIPEIAEVEWLDELRSRTRRNSQMDELTTLPVEEWYGPDPRLAAATRAPRQGRGFPFVSVRGLFDAGAQVSEYVDAIHRSYADAEKRLEFIDFHLERQTFNRRRNDWSSWEPVDMQVFLDVAESARGFEPDVVSSEATDTAITAPLLMRVTGRWQTQATHPLLRGSDPSPEELERESAFHEAVLELLREQRRPERDSRIEKGGFARLLHDARTLEQELFDSVRPRASVSTQPQAGLRSWFAPRIARRPQTDLAVDELVRRITHKIDPKQSDRDLREWVLNRMSRTSSRQLLFRYFDFDVEPGATYRYHVRLELRNPNFGRSLAAARGNAHVVEGMTRLTPWSEPTDPVQVAETVHYFLAGFDDARHRQHPLARMSVFQYDTHLGTVVHQELPVEIGQQIAGTARAILRDPAAGIEKEEEYTFHSRDTLLDGLPDLTFDKSLHPDLQLPAGSLGQAHIPEYALVLAHGQLRTIDPLSQAEEYARQQRFLERQAEQLRHLQSNSGRFVDGRDEYEREMYEEMYGVPADNDRPQPRRRNMLQRGR